MLKYILTLIAIILTIHINRAQQLNLQVLEGVSNFHNESGSDFLEWQPSFAIGIKSNNKKNSLSVGLHYETKGARKDLENWKYKLKYLSISVGTGIKSKEGRTLINVGSYFSLLASLNISGDNSRLVGFAKNHFQKVDYGFYFDYSYFFYTSDKYSLGIDCKINYGISDIFEDSAVLITTQDNKWTRNFTGLIGLIISKKK